jgi:MtrB/PioB family decaheme-associated outer membrane protein
MKKKIYSAVIVLSLAVPALAVAAEENKTEVHGQVELGVRGVDSNANSAFFQEYSDLDDGIIGKVQLDAQKGAYHLELDAKNPGADDQFFQLKGGEYGNFKYKFKYNEMPHNYTFDAITPYTGLGTQNLTIVGTPADTSTWTKFDYAVANKDYGGEVELSFKSPFYVNFGAERRERDGMRPYSFKTGPAEVPEPISHSTNNLTLKGGYLGESLSASLSGLLSTFENDQKNYFVGDPTDINRNVVLAADNEYSKIAGDLAWRDLPLDSVLAAGLSYAHQENSYTAAEIGFTPAHLATLANLNRTNFEGDIDYTNASIALSSQPMDKLDTKIYYRYVERDNNSSIISYGADPATASTNNARELLSYEKNTAGIDLGYRLPGKTKLDAGYEYLNTDRSTELPAYTAATTFYRYANPESTTDDTVYLGFKNSALDWLTAKIKYTRLDRDSDLDTTGVVNPTIYTSRFDALAKTMDEWKLGFELYPAESVDLGLDFKYQHHDYDENNSSRTDEKRQSVYADVTWRAVQAATLSGFVGFEKTEIDANKRVNNELAPSRVETTDDDFWTYGLAANIAATDKLTFNLSWQHQESDGALNFTSLDGTVYNNITEADDYTKKTLEAKAIYAIDPAVKLTLGYIYEKLEYSDINYANYANVVGTSYYSGLYANPNYEANVGYLMVSYGF